VSTCACIGAASSQSCSLQNSAWSVNVASSRGLSAAVLTVGGAVPTRIVAADFDNDTLLDVLLLRRSSANASQAATALLLSNTLSQPSAFLAADTSLWGQAAASAELDQGACNTLVLPRLQCRRWCRQ
jgi:hypothetical protein